MKLNWGTGIAGVYIAFALATTGFVSFAMGRPVDLVQPDYYAQALRQDERMEAIANADRLGTAATIVEPLLRNGALARLCREVVRPYYAARCREAIDSLREACAGLPLAMSLNLDFDGDAPQIAEQTPPSGPDRATIERAFDAEAVRQGLERGESAR